VLLGFSVKVRSTPGNT